MNEINTLLNDKFKVLICLYKYRGPDNFSRISQQEISEILNINRVTINKIFKELNETGFVKSDTKYLSRYFLTEKAIKTVETINKLTKLQK